MSRTNKILLAILGVLLLILGLIGGAILLQSNPFSSRTLAQPYNETRYAGTLEDASALTDDPDLTHVVLVVHFYDDGDRGTVTSPTLPLHAELKKTGDGEYEQQAPVVGTGGEGNKWSFTPHKAKINGKNGSDNADNGTDNDQEKPSDASPALETLIPRGEVPTDDNPADPAEPADPAVPQDPAIDGEPADDGMIDMGFSITTPDGETTDGQLEQTDKNDKNGEIGINPDVADAEKLEYGDFGDDRTRAIGRPVFQKNGEEPLLLGDPEKGPKEAKDGPQTKYEHYPPVENGSYDRLGEHTVIFRLGNGSHPGTVTYPERGCYGELEVVELQATEKILVGDCESGGTWRFLEGTPQAGVAEFLSHDASFSGRTVYRATDWDDIDGEIGLGQSGPVVDYYKGLRKEEPEEEELTFPTQDETPEELRERSAREGGVLTHRGTGPYVLGMSKQEAIDAGLDPGSFEPDNKCERATTSFHIFRDGELYFENGTLVAFGVADGHGLFHDTPVSPAKPGENDDPVPGHKPELIQKGETGFLFWTLTDDNGVQMQLRVVAEISANYLTLTAPGQNCLDSKSVTR